MSLVYAAILLLNVIFTYGFETAYFRFAQRKEYETTIYSTASISLISSTILFASLLWLFQGQLAAFSGIPDYPLLIQLSIVIISLDTLATLPFARLRQQGRPVYFAFVRITSILINIGATVFFLSYCPHATQQNPHHWLSYIYNPELNPV